MHRPHGQGFWKTIIIMLYQETTLVRKTLLAPLLKSGTRETGWILLQFQALYFTTILQQLKCFSMITMNWPCVSKRVFTPLSLISPGEYGMCSP